MLTNVEMLAELSQERVYSRKCGALRAFAGCCS